MENGKLMSNLYLRHDYPFSIKNLSIQEKGVLS